MLNVMTMANYVDYVMMLTIIDHCDIENLCPCLTMLTTIYHI